MFIHLQLVLYRLDGYRLYRLMDIGYIHQLFFGSSSTTRGKGKGKLYVYERDIMCLPQSFLQHGNIKIPRKKHVRHFLAMNELVAEF